MKCVEHRKLVECLKTFLFCLMNIACANLKYMARALLFFRPDA